MKAMYNIGCKQSLHLEMSWNYILMKAMYNIRCKQSLHLENGLELHFNDHNVRYSVYLRIGNKTCKLVLHQAKYQKGLK